MRFTFLIPFVMSGAAAAQALPMNGFDHFPLGDAQLSNDNGILVVSNIGSSGQDGVRTRLAGADFYNVQFMAEGAIQAPGSFMKISTLGQVDAPDDPIWTLSVKNLGNAFGISMNMGDIGPQQMRVLTWKDGLPVAELAVPIFNPDDIIVEVPPFGCRVDPVWTMGPIDFPPGGPIWQSTWALFDLEEIGDVTIVNPLTNAPITVQADRMAIEVLHDKPIGPLSDAFLRGMDVDKVEICDETFGWHHHEHSQLGNSNFSISNGFLKVANIGSSGLDGVCLWLDEIFNQVTDNGLRIPLQPVQINPGQSMMLEAFGSVGGRSTGLGISEMKFAPGGLTELTADFSSLGGTKARIVGLLAGDVVADEIVDMGVVGTISDVVVLGSCGKLPPDFEPFPPIGPIIVIGPPQPPCFFWGLNQPAELDILQGAGDTLVTVDEIRVLAVDVPPVDGLERFGITGRNLDEITLLDEKTLFGSAFVDLGGADPGTNGDPVLGAHGTLTPGSQNILGISNGLPSSPAVLFFALSQAAVPFKGGTLQAFPVLGSVPLTTNANGTINLPFTWPAALPAGLTPTFQAAIADSGASKNVALTNAVMGTSH